MTHRSTKLDYAGPLLKGGPPPTWPSKPTIDQRAIDRILTAVGNKFIPPSLNRVALWTAIKKAAEDADVFDRFRSGPRTRAMSKAINRIGKASDALAKLVKENGDVAELITNVMPNSLITIQQLTDCSTYIAWSLSSSNESIRAKYDRVPSLMEWLVGVELPNIFEEFFKRKVGSSRSKDGPTGPTVRFVTAVMKEVACPSNSETIIRAITRYSKLRTLRRAIGQRARLEILERRLRLLKDEERQRRAARDA